MAQQEYIQEWNEFLNIIRDNIVEDAFAVWFKPLKFGGYQDNHITIITDSQFVSEYIEEHFLDIVKQAIYRVFGQGTKLRYIAKIGNDADNKQHLTTDSTGITPNILINTTPNEANNFKTGLDKDLRLDNFIVGKPNKVVYNIATRIISGNTQFNPLFIYGSCGVGKTHIANAIGLKYKENFANRKVLYMSTQKFETLFGDAVIKNNRSQFQNFFLDIDCLILDDFQSLAIGNKVATIQAFFHIFNEMKASNKQLIVCCDREPQKLDKLDDRLISRFASGLPLKIDKPDKELIRAVLHNEIINNSLELSTECIEYLHNNLPNNIGIREIKGIVLSICARTILDPVITCQTIKEILLERSMYEKEHNVITPDQICQAVCDKMNVTMEQLSSSSKKREIAEPRQIAMYLMKNLTDITLREIGNFFGGRDHSTVLCAHKSISDRRGNEPKLESLLKNITESIPDYID